MESYIGKSCPHCKTPLQEGDKVKVCPVCGVAHHESCWDQNGGCSTFGCTGQEHICETCGAVLYANLPFCPQCGASKFKSPTESLFGDTPPAVQGNPPITPQPAFTKACPQCGTPLTDEHDFCPQCGTRVAAPTNTAFTPAPATPPKKKKKKKSAAPVVSIIIVVGILLAGVLGMLARNAYVKREYLENAREFLSIANKVGDDLQALAVEVEDYWVEYTTTGAHGSTAEEALQAALDDNADAVETIKEYDAEIKAVYAKIMSVPKYLSESDTETLTDINTAVYDLYEDYVDLYNLALYPSGTYISYAGDYSSCVISYATSYAVLDLLI